MAVTAAMVKELRELTGAGLVDCKNALTATDGDMGKAVVHLREKGLAAAQKKSGRIAAEGLVYTAVDASGKRGVVVEVNSETDFVAKNREFRSFVEAVAAQALGSRAETVDELLAEKWGQDASMTVKDALVNRVAVIGENLSIRRFARFIKEDSGLLSTYIHGGGTTAVLLDISCEKVTPLVEEMGKNVCMQAAAMYPKYLTRGDIPAEYVESETEIATQLTKNDEKNASKPANVLEKMIAGRVAKTLKEICLSDQPYVKDNGVTVAQYVAQCAKEAGFPITLTRFVSYNKGEGLQKKVEDFAAEVEKAMAKK
jgi:elongation factor Ts